MSGLVGDSRAGPDVGQLSTAQGLDVARYGETGDVREVEHRAPDGDPRDVVRDADVATPRGQPHDGQEGVAGHGVAADGDPVDHRVGGTLAGEEGVREGARGVVAERDAPGTLARGVGLDVEGAVAAHIERDPLDDHVLAGDDGDPVAARGVDPGVVDPDIARPARGRARLVDEEGIAVHPPDRHVVDLDAVTLDHHRVDALLDAGVHARRGAVALEVEVADGDVRVAALEREQRVVLDGRGGRVGAQRGAVAIEHEAMPVAHPQAVVHAVGARAEHDGRAVGHRGEERVERCRGVRSTRAVDGPGHGEGVAGGRGRGGRARRRRGSRRCRCGRGRRGRCRRGRRCGCRRDRGRREGVVTRDRLHARLVRRSHAEVIERPGREARQDLDVRGVVERGLAHGRRAVRAGGAVLDLTGRGHVQVPGDGHGAGADRRRRDAAHDRPGHGRRGRRGRFRSGVGRGVGSGVG